MFAIHLDGRIAKAGAYNPDTGITTWTLPAPDAEIDTIVLGEAFGDKAGKVLVPASNSGLSVTATGDFGGGRVAVLGRSYNMALKLSRQFFRDDSGVVVAKNRVQIDRIRIMHRESLAYTVRSAMPMRT